MNTALRRLASLRLTLSLLFALAVCGALGSGIPQGLPAELYPQRFPETGRLILTLGLDDYYRGPLYRGLLGLFTANLLACAAGRSAAGWRRFRGAGRAALETALGDREAWRVHLRARGFRVLSVTPLRARKAPWAFLGFPLTHLSLPVLMGGALWGSVAGFVGTQNVHVGAEMPTFFNWADQRDTPLPFRLAVEDFRLLHYPRDLRLQVRIPQAEPLVVDIREGARLPVAGTPYRVWVERFDAESGDLTYWVEGAGKRFGPFGRGREAGAPLTLRPLAFREAQVALLGSDGTVRSRRVVAVNEPLVHGDLRIYLTAWGRDADDFPYVGFQIVRDPGQPAVWAGALGLAAGVLLLLFGRGAWVVERDGALHLYASGGRRAASGLLPAPGEPAAPPGGEPAPRA